MRLLVSLEMRFLRTPDGAVWTRIAHSYEELRYLLEVFDHLTILARVRDVGEVSSDWLRSDGPSISFAPLPYYVGPWQYLVRTWRVRSAAWAALSAAEAVVADTPSAIATCVAAAAGRAGRPYGVRVIGDPYDVFARGVVDHPLRPFLRWWFAKNLKAQCREACAVGHATDWTLQKRYPPGPSAFSTSFAVGFLHDEAFATHVRQPSPDAMSPTLITVATLEQLYKGTDVLLDALALCDGLKPRLTIVGDGKFRRFLENRARSLGVGDRVRFVGELPAGQAVRDELARAHAFVLPSRTEGLPRALIEAMALALPCIGTTVGGIPELLPAEDMVAPGDARALAAKLREVLSDPARMARMSARNLEKAATFHERTIHERRMSFYRYLKDRTEAWLTRRR